MTIISSVTLTNSDKTCVQNSLDEILKQLKAPHLMIAYIFFLNVVLS